MAHRVSKANKWPLRNMCAELGARFKCFNKRPLPDHEVAFHRLDKAELEACLAWECYRERALINQDSIFQEAEVVEKSKRSEEAKFMRLLELQRELDAERKASRPWLSLEPQDRNAFLMRIRKTRHVTEPFALFSELSPMHRLWARWSPRCERLEVLVDWSKSNKKLVASFTRLVTRLRKNGGTKANLIKIKDGRGSRSTVKQDLFRLAIWRCHKAGLNAKRALTRLEQLRIDFGPAPSTVEKKYTSIAKECEQDLLSARPT